MAPKTSLSRRAMLGRTALGFGSLGLYSLLSEASLLAEPPAGPLAARKPHFAARAKRIIFLFMHGGVSHVDTFDPKRQQPAVRRLARR